MIPRSPVRPARSDWSGAGGIGMAPDTALDRSQRGSAAMALFAVFVVAIAAETVVTAVRRNAI